MSFEQIIAGYDAHIIRLAMLLRSTILTALKNVEEQPDTAARIIGYGYGPGYKDSICTIIPSKKEIKLGFYKGAQLPDPQQLLTGKGKVHKYVVIRSEEDVTQRGVQQLLQDAFEAWQERQ